MPHFQFDFIELEDFRSYVGKHRFEFGDIGLHLLKGKNKHKPSLGANDAGKSTLWDGFCWVLTGYMVKKLRNNKAAPWAKPRATSRGRVSFLRDKKRYVVERTANPGKLLINGTESGPGELATLGLPPFEIFTQSVLMGQGKPLFFDLKGAERMELFSDTLRLSRWEERSKVASKKLDKLETDEKWTKQYIVTEKSNLESVVKDLKETKERARTWEDEQDNKIRNRQEQIKKSNSQIAKLQKIKDEADLLTETVGLGMKEAKLDLDAVMKAVDELQEDKAKNGSDMAGHTNAIKFHSEALQGLANADECPTCHQSIKGSDLAKHRQEIVVKRNACRKKLAKLELDMKVIQADLDKTLRGRTMLGERHGNLFSKHQEAESTLRIATTDFANATALVNSLKRELAELDNAENPYSVIQVKLRKRRDELKTKIEGHEDDLAKVQKLLEPTKFWVKGFKDVRLQIIDETLHELELSTNYMLPEFGLDDWEVLYDIEKELKSGAVKPELNVRIYSPDSKEIVGWEELGGGVGQRLRLISALALSEVLLNHAGIITNIEILDEPTRSLNVEGVNDLCDFLANRAEDQKKSIWLIDHRSIESTAFSTVRTIVKDKNGSHIK